MSKDFDKQNKWTVMNKWEHGPSTTHILFMNITSLICISQKGKIYIENALMLMIGLLFIDNES